MRRVVCLGSLGALVFAVAFTVPANARTVGDGTAPQPVVGNVTGGDVTPDGTAPPMTQQASDKVAATLAWNAAMKAGNPAGAAKALDAYTAKWGTAGPGSRPMSTGKTLAAATSRFLGVDQVGQNKGYYCGPASGYEIIRYLHGAGFTSRYDGSAPGQAGLANGNHMATDANQVTAWSTGRWVTGVNRWRGVNYYVQVHAPSSLSGILTYSIGGAGMPFAGDTVEIVNGAHYNGHPRDKTIGHWIVAYGYSSSGAVGNWADSSTTVWAGVSRYFTANSGSFNSYLQSNGVAY